jgi:nitronate monooxygenase
MEYKIPVLKIDDLQTRIPIVQGGMGVGISLSSLASAVANEGAIGVISSVGIGGLESRNWRDLKKQNLLRLAEEIARGKERSGGIIGVNIMSAANDYRDALEVALTAGTDIVFIGAGLFLSLPDKISLRSLRASGTKIIPIVSSARAARIIFSTWDRRYGYIPDGIVVEGPKAGGHLGFKKEQIANRRFKLEELILPVISEISPYRLKYQKDLPVIAAGGIYTGKDIFKLFRLGIQGIQMGTRFVATRECDASPEFKNLYLKAKKRDIGIIDSPVGLPGRAIIGDFLRKAAAGDEKPGFCQWQCLRTCNIKTASYCIGKALVNAQKGLLEKGFAFAGANAYRVKKIVSVHELITELMDDFLKSCRRHSISFA